MKTKQNDQRKRGSKNYINAVLAENNKSGHENCFYSFANAKLSGEIFKFCEMFGHIDVT